MSRYKSHKRRKEIEKMFSGGFKQKPEERLPYETRSVKVGRKTIEVYEIPDEKKEEVLASLYLTTNVPGLDEERFDLHAGKVFRVRDFLVTREDEQNYLVSPFYLEGGGTVIDWMSADVAEQYQRTEE